MIVIYSFKSFVKVTMYNFAITPFDGKIQIQLYTRSSESTVITVRLQRKLKREYGGKQIISVASVVLHSFLLVNGYYCITSTHAERGMLKNAKPIGRPHCEAFALPSQRSLLSVSNAL